MLILGRVLLIGILICIAPAVDAAPNSKRVALVIGNSAYKNTAPLANPRNDAEAMAAALKRLNFDVVLALDVTQAQMAEVVREFSRRLRGADVALLFYAGHGLSYEGQNYVVPIDAAARDELDITFGMHPIRTITEQMARAARLNIVLLDACRDNPLVRGLSRSLGATRSSALGRGLARIEQVGQQSYVMLATKDGDVAADGEGNHSPFTQELLRHMEVKGQTIEELARNVRKGVREITKERQNPLAINSLEDAFYFNPPDSGGAPAAGAQNVKGDEPQDRRRDALYWESIKDLNSVDMFRVYIEKFPSGDFVEIAKAKIRQLEAGKSAGNQMEAAATQRDAGFPAAQPSPDTSAGGSFAPSFDCGATKLPVEIAICANRRLAELDVELVQVYALAKARMTKQQSDALLETQRQWLRQRNACGGDVSCIENYYVSRIRQLRGFLG